MIVAFALTVFYALLLIFLTLGVLRNRKPNWHPHRTISVIVAARNEEANLPRLLESLANQDYPSDHFEIVLADDRSNDKTFDIMNDFCERHDNFHCVRILDSDEGHPGKKRALARAIEASSGEILAFTDADCRPGPNWLAEVDRHLEGRVDFIAGYSPLVTSSGAVVDGLKNLERASIFAVTAGSMGWKWGLTCTARNMAYTHALYDKADGFRGIEHIPSGDDDLMLQKLGRISGGMRFMFTRESVVPSYENDTASTQINRETRRASKWRWYPLSVKVLTLMVMLYYLSLAVCLVGAIVGFVEWVAFIEILVAKILAEFVLLMVYLCRMRRVGLIGWFPVAEVLYIPYFVYFGLRGTFGGYRWKS